MLLILGGVLLFVRNDAWNSSILGVYICGFGVLTFILEFMIPELIVYNMGFMFSMLGRGFFYLSMGILCLAWKWFNIVVGCIIIAIGVFYVGMHFLGATPSPSMSAVPTPMDDGMDEDYAHDVQHAHSQDHLQPSMTQTYQSPVTANNYGTHKNS
ncbi:Late Golgi vesicles protein [Mortierella sp. AM989]|nr:Late Golgi vesicles protein [Mortierella sp. AM989]